MLIEDVGLRTMPIGGRTDRQGFTISVTPPSSQVEELIASGLDRNEHGRQLASSVCHFIDMVARTVMAFGEAVYEIAYLSPSKETAPTAFELAPVIPGTLVSIDGSPHQRIPTDFAKEMDLPFWIEFDEQDLARFQLPSSIRREHPKMMRSLSRMGSAVIPEFALDPDQASTMGFDFKVFRRAQELALAQATKSLGWNARGLLEKQFLEYYILLREIRFQAFLIELRETMLDSLNNSLRRVGEKLGFGGQLKIAGMPTQADIDTALRKLNAGEGKFTELLKPFSLL